MRMESPLPPQLTSSSSSSQPSSALSSRPSSALVSLSSSSHLTSRVKELRRSGYAFLEARFMADGPVYTIALAYVLLNSVMFAHGFVLESQKVSGVQKYTAVLARGYGYMLNLNVGLILLVASRSTITLLRRSPLNMIIPFDVLMPTAHMVLGYVCLALGALHGIFHLIPGILVHLWAPGFLKWTFAVATGFGALAVLLVISIFAAPRIRRQKFELFYYTHAIGGVLFFAVLLVHGIRFGKLYSWKWVVPFMVLYILDRTCRKLLERRGYVSVDVSSSSTYANGKIIKFVIPKCMDYKAGQWAELCVPSLSEFQWHPFTIASAPRETSMSFFIKTAGDWTSKLSLILDEMKDAASLEDSHMTFDYGRPSSRDLQCRIRGAYGAPTQHVGQFEKVVLISGGVGSTPFLSVVKDIVHHLDEKYPQPVEELMSLKLERKDSNHSAAPSERRTFTDDVFQTDSKSSKLKLRSIVEVVGGAGHRDPYRPSPALVSNLQRMYYFLASTTVAFVVLWLGIVRAFNTSMAAALNPHMKLADFLGFQALPFVYQVIDMALASLVALPTLLMIGLELIYGQREIALVCKVIDIAVVGPVLVTPVVTNVLFFLQVYGDRRTVYSVLFHYVLWPLTVLVMLFRHTRNGSGTTVIASSFRNNYENTRSVDFIYTTPDSGSDDWLVANLAPYSSSRHFRLHRYLTRETMDEARGPEYVGRFKTSYGRPDWDRIFESLVRSARSGSSMGVFFCGPKQMELDVREACYSAMTRSRRRGLHYGVGSGTPTSFPSAGISRISSRSCNVRLSIRAEKF